MVGVDKCVCVTVSSFLIVFSFRVCLQNALFNELNWKLSTVNERHRETKSERYRVCSWFFSSSASSLDFFISFRCCYGRVTATTLGPKSKQIKPPECNRTACCCWWNVFLRFVAAEFNEHAFRSRRLTTCNTPHTHSHTHPYSIVCWLKTGKIWLRASKTFCGLEFCQRRNTKTDDREMIDCT